MFEFQLAAFRIVSMQLIEHNYVYIFMWCLNKTVSSCWVVVCFYYIRGTHVATVTASCKFDCYNKSTCLIIKSYNKDNKAWIENTMMVCTMTLCNLQNQINLSFYVYFIAPVSRLKV